MQPNTSLAQHNRFVIVIHFQRSNYNSFLSSKHLFNVHALLSHNKLQHKLNLHNSILPSNSQILANTRHLLRAKVILGRIRTRHIRETSKVVLIRRHIRSGRVLMFIILHVPRDITQNTKQLRTRQLMSKTQAQILLKRHRPSTIRTRTNQFKHRAMHRSSQRRITQMTTPTMIATRRRLSTNKTQPTVSISRRGRTSSIIYQLHISFTILIVININRCHPYSNTTKLQVTCTQLIKLLPIHPHRQTSRPHICSNTFHLDILTNSLKNTVMNIRLVRTQRIISTNQTRIRRLPLSQQCNSLQKRLAKCILVRQWYNVFERSLFLG